jgi:hypothetical protein
MCESVFCWRGNTFCSATRLKLAVNLRLLNISLLNPNRYIYLLDIVRHRAGWNDLMFGKAAKSYKNCSCWLLATGYCCCLYQAGIKVVLIHPFILHHVSLKVSRLINSVIMSSKHYFIQNQSVIHCPLGNHYIFFYYSCIYLWSTYGNFLKLYVSNKYYLNSS